MIFSGITVFLKLPFESDFATTGKSYRLSRSMVAYSDSGKKIYRHKF
jgi:hypothetical protein